jgi:calcineurin-like phosphoesterase family protein
MYKQIILQLNQEVYITSDSHYHHLNICKATTTWKDSDDVTRKFTSIDQMNDCIVNSINSVVGQDDILIHLGDWSFNGFDNIKLFRDRIICKSIYLIPGNHDQHILKNQNNIQDIFTEIYPQITVLNIKRKLNNTKNTTMYKKYNLVLSHYPQCSWIDMNKEYYHLHGHVHLPNHLKLGQGKSLDVGVDGNNYIPYSLTQIDNLLSKQPIKKLCLPSDHHEKRL